MSLFIIGGFLLILALFSDHKITHSRDTRIVFWYKVLLGFQLFFGILFLILGATL